MCLKQVETLLKNGVEMKKNRVIEEQKLLKSLSQSK